jgi:hypothetical protein
MPASRHQDHTTSPSASSALVRRAQSVHRIPRPTFVTIAIRPSSGAQDAGSNARDLPDVTSKSGCDRLARRANQPFADEPKTPDVNDQSSFPVLPAGRAHATVSRLGKRSRSVEILDCVVPYARRGGRRGYYFRAFPPDAASRNHGDQRREWARQINQVWFSRPFTQKTPEKPG